MPDAPYPITSDDPKQAIAQVRALIDELFQEKLAGADIGDVFSVGEDDIFTINLSETGGLQKTESTLATKIDPNTDNVLSVSATGIRIPNTKIYAIGEVAIFAVATNPNTLLGYGTWELVATGDLVIADGGSYQTLIEKDAANGYAGLNGVSRTVKGVDTTDDIIIDLATKGLVLKDTQGTPHYWRVQISNLGALTTTDLGTSKS
jgi:hypothetical protein